MIVSDLSFLDFKKRARDARLVIAYGPVAARICAKPKVLLQDIYDVYRDYPVMDLEAQGADFTVDVRPTSWIRGIYKPSYYCIADKPGPFAPLPLDISFVGYEMSQNWQIACTYNRHLLFHAATIADAQGNAILMPGLSGSGKSTLGAAMGFREWRFLGDEFGVFNADDQSFIAMPRPISLKNASIDVMKAWASDGRFSRTFKDTPKGTMAYLQPPAGTLAPPLTPARMSMAIFPRYVENERPAARRLRGAEAAIELTNACVNFSRVGRPAFEQIMIWANTIPVYRVSYPSLDAAVSMVSDLHRKALDAS